MTKRPLKSPNEFKMQSKIVKDLGLTQQMDRFAYEELWLIKEENNKEAKKRKLDQLKGVMDQHVPHKQRKPGSKMPVGMDSFDAISQSRFYLDDKSLRNSCEAKER